MWAACLPCSSFRRENVGEDGCLWHPAAVAKGWPAPGPGALGGQTQELETARRRFPLRKPHVAMPRVWEACEKHDVAYGSGFGRLFWRMRTLVESSALVASGV